MNFHKITKEFRCDGFVVVRQFLSTDEFSELNVNLDRYIRDVVPSLPNADAFYQDQARPETLKQLQHMGNDTFFDNYRKHSCWIALAEALLGESAEAKEPEWFNKPPATDHSTPPHQDNYYFCLQPPNVLTMWLALDSVDDENGCLRYLPGSHLNGLRPHGASEVLGFSQGITDYGHKDEAREVTVHLAPGDMAIHHGEMVHRADPNRSSTRSRRAFAMVIRGESCQRDEEKYLQYRAAVNSQHEKKGLEINK